MARNHARLLTSIWTNDDFKRLPAGAQRLFMLALSQPNLSYAGVVPFTAKRWAALAVDTTPKTLEKAADDLAAKGFVVIDRDTEELWVRSFLKYDGVLSSPNLIRAMAKDFAAIHSETIRDGFLKQIPEPLPEGFAKAFPEGVPEPFAKGFPRDPQPHDPAPSPTPPASRAVAAAPAGDAEVVQHAAHRLTAEFWEASNPKPSTKFIALRKLVERFLDAGWPEDAVADALRRAKAFTLAGIEFTLRSHHSQAEPEAWAAIRAAIGEPA